MHPLLVRYTGVGDFGIDFIPVVHVDKDELDGLGGGFNEGLVWLCITSKFGAVWRASSGERIFRISESLEMYLIIEFGGTVFINSC